MKRITECNKCKRVAFQGTNGAYSEQALFKYFTRDVEPVGYRLSKQVFEAVESDEVDFGILPIENSIVGAVTINLDFFYEHDFFVVGEEYLEINHNLLALPGVKIEDIEKVHSHPVALEQCKGFLDKYGLKAIPDFDTAGAADELSQNKKRNQGTISSSLCAEYYDLEILAENIQDVQNNITRFLVFSKKEHVPENLKMEKTSIAFTTTHEPGALLNCLKVFSDHSINLTKLESRPIPHNPFAYIFYVDFIGSLKDDNTERCLVDLKEIAKDIKILGSYPKAELIK